MIAFGAMLKTSGDGYWTQWKKIVQCTHAEIAYLFDDGGAYGELRVYFNTESWDVNTCGLIYTDKQFLEGVKEVFKEAGFDISDIDYSEQGMQGADYVSLDVGEKFLASWKEIVG